MKFFIFFILSLLLLMLSHNMAISQEKPQREFEMEENGKTYVMKQYIMCLLFSGPKRDQSPEEAEEIQRGHMNHINKLAGDGKILVAGPFGDDTELRGILIFDVDDVSTAEKLQGEDPAVKSGRLRAEFHPWWTSKEGSFR